MDDPFEWAKKFDEWSKDKKDSKEIIKIMQAIHLLMDGCSHNLNTAQLTKVQKRMKTTIKQCIFWRNHNNRKRFIYDLREFGIWLADFISDAEEEYWENENNP